MQIVDEIHAATANLIQILKLNIFSKLGKLMKFYFYDSRQLQKI